MQRRLRAEVVDTQPVVACAELEVEALDEEEEFPMEAIDAAAITMLADEIEEKAAEEPVFEFDEDEFVPAVEETMIAFADEVVPDEKAEDLPFYAADEDFSAPIEDEEFPPLEQDEEVPEWLTDEAAFAAEEALAQAAAEEEEMPLEMGELPDWLQEEPTEDWLTQEQTQVAETVEVIPDDWAAEPLELPDEDFIVTPDEFEKPKKKRRKVSTRALEIILGLLIVLAVAVMIGLVYVFFTM